MEIYLSSKMVDVDDVYLAFVVSVSQSSRRHGVIEQSIAKAFAEGEPEHLVLAQTKPLPEPLDECLMPEKDRVGLFGLFRFFGFLAHDPRMAAIP